MLLGTLSRDVVSLDWASNNQTKEENYRKQVFQYWSDKNKPVTQKKHPVLPLMLHKGTLCNIVNKSFTNFLNSYHTEYWDYNKA